MAAVNIIPVMGETITGAGGGAVDHDYTVPGGKRWQFTYVELEFTVSNVGNTVDLQHPAGTNIWPQLGNFLKMNPDLLVRYPLNGVQLEAGDVFRLAWTRAGAVTAVTSRVYITERDI